MRTVSLDFETFYIKDEYSILEQGSVGYVRDPRFDPYLVSVCDGKEVWSGPIQNFNWDAIQGARLLSHNRYFDQSVNDEMVRRGWAPAIKYHDWKCTASLTMFLAMRRDLLRATEFLLGEQVDKSYRDDANGKHWDDIVKEGKAEKVMAAGRVDAVRCFQFWAKFGHLWPQMEQDLSDLTIRQGTRGVQIDFERLRRDLVVAQTALIQAESVLPWMKEGKKPTGTKAIAEECRKVGIPCPPVKKRDGEEAYDLWAATYGPRHQWVKAYTDYRVLNKFIGILEKIRGRLDSSAIFPFDLLYFGAHTGRWAGGGGYNMQNMRKEPLYIDTEGWLVTDAGRLKEIEKQVLDGKPLPDFVAYALDVRALFIARPGKNLIISDLSQIEPRVLAWTVDDQVMLKSMAAGQSPYEAHARATMNWTGGSLKKGDPNLYALAKARVLGLGFQCGWEKFITVAMNMAGLDITKDDPESVPVFNDEGQPALENKDGVLVQKMESGYGYTSKKTVKDYRESNPKIVALWEKLDTAFKDSEGSDFAITLPSGRQLRYPEVQRQLRMTPDPDNPGKYKRKMMFTALAFDEKQNAVVRKPFYGGILTENYVQATARDIFGEHLLRLDRTSGVDVLFSVHDEAVNECDQGITPKDIEHIMSYCPPWLEGCPLAAEAILAPHYKK